MPSPDRRGQATFGAFGITYLDKLAEPAFEGRQVSGNVRQGVNSEARWLPGAISANGSQASVQGTGPIVRGQVGNQVHHDRADSLAGTPALLAVTRAIVQPKSEGRSGRFLITVVH